MAEPKSFELAHEYNVLWPAIADALDTFLRRRTRGMAGYERVWRLIHVWESIEITLASITICCFRSDPALKDNYRRAREACYGKSWNEVDKTFKVVQGSFDGSIDRWIDVLFLVAKVDNPSDPLLSSLKAFLDSQSIDIKSLVQPWGSACDVPPDAQKEKFKVRDAMRHVNTFRNRFAHVPFPYDPIDRIANALEAVTDQLFSVEPLPWKAGSVLAGGIADKGRLLQGVHSSAFDDGTSLSFVFPARCGKDSQQQKLDASPFVFIDEMMRPYVLTRLKDRDNGTWEYTRFRAEANAVITQDKAELLTQLPEPSQAEYGRSEEEAGLQVSEAVVPVPPTVSAGPDEEDAAPPHVTLAPAPLRFPQTHQEAIQAIRDEDFEGAIQFFQQLVTQQPDYHIGWLRLGYAQREKAMRLRDSDAIGANGLLATAIESLTKATEHHYDDQRARALYERSKAEHQLYRLAADQKYKADAVKDAEDACRLSPDTRYLTWVEYLGRLT